MRNLRRTIASIVLAAPLGGGCLPGSCPHHDPIEETIDLPAMPDAQTMQDIMDCKNAAPGSMYACDPLCRDIYDARYADYRNFDKCELVTDSTTGLDAVHYIATYQCIGGRRPHGFRHRRPCGPAVGAYLAQQAELEAASVRAFDDMLADLVANGAPAMVQRAARAAAADEVRHARVCDLLARRYGSQPRYAELAAAPRRGKLALALDNAVEGCVREMYGAAVAAYQARVASDATIRTAMRGIWRDEAKHAALSWRLHRWLMPQLAAGEQREVATAMRDARAELAPIEEAADVHHVAGVPQPEAATALLAGLDATVWS